MDTFVLPDQPTYEDYLRAGFRLMVAVRDTIRGVSVDYHDQEIPGRRVTITLDWQAGQPDQRLRLVCKASHLGTFFELYLGSGNITVGEGIVAGWSLYRDPRPAVQRDDGMSITGISTSQPTQISLSENTASSVSARPRRSWRPMVG